MSHCQLETPPGGYDIVIALCNAHIWAYLTVLPPATLSLLLKLRFSKRLLKCTRTNQYILVAGQFADAVHANGQVWLAAKKFLERVDDLLLIGRYVGHLLCKHNDHQSIFVLCLWKTTVADRLGKDSKKYLSYKGK